MRVKPKYHVFGHIHEGKEEKREGRKEGEKGARG